WKVSRGPTLSALAGLTYFATAHLGVNFELGYQWHWYKVYAPDLETDMASRLGQLFMALNCVVALGRPFASD
ncbi:MAG: hypothetical protein RLZZ450_6801, partial [Pseudomonadota bacterium]